MAGGDGPWCAKASRPIFAPQPESGGRRRTATSPTGPLPEHAVRQLPFQPPVFTAAFATAIDCGLRGEAATRTRWVEGSSPTCAHAHPPRPPRPLGPHRCPERARCGRRSAPATRRMVTSWNAEKRFHSMGGVSKSAVAMAVPEGVDGKPHVCASPSSAHRCAQGWSATALSPAPCGT